jgi:hypothetical protein
MKELSSDIFGFRFGDVSESWLLWLFNTEEPLALLPYEVSPAVAPQVPSTTTAQL